jgi:hypothetical protein
MYSAFMEELSGKETENLKHDMDFFGLIIPPGIPAAP